ncbi:hypothetical protein CJ030_MR7G012516 [Morella rubra]|uniref:Uncharacterized protein n=1 Tax=Morella rubra TaxID=262757 RepID=A0A6A1UHU3_9ROSI|nr:hypothetical protein CJ030_MR0G012581 [Morella rubra]KAB1205467.1 hypothetical protein CJ030_MR7G010592 [Morella rubra]KAB1207440.1 hypothetical protein CJ030_MR7G012516 [Morella rubra]
MAPSNSGRTKTKFEGGRTLKETYRKLLIGSKKSLEKLLLPHPTDLDLGTLRWKDEAEAGAWLLGISSSSTMSLLFLKEEPTHFSFYFPTKPFAVVAIAASATVKAVILELSFETLVHRLGSTRL